MVLLHLLEVLDGAVVGGTIVNNDQFNFAGISLADNNAIDGFFQIMLVRVVHRHQHGHFRKISCSMDLMLHGETHGILLAPLTSNKVSDMDSIKDLFPVESQVDHLVRVQKRVHVLQTSLFFCSGIHFSLGFFFCFFYLTQPVNRCVVDILDFVHRDYSHDWPI